MVKSDDLTDMDKKEVCCEDVGGPVTALALNKATNQVAVAGRSIFKIYGITEKGFELSSNLRVVKNIVASFNDVTWNQVDENIVATASPNGAVVTWNLNKPGLSKMDINYQDHRRTVNKVHFHCNDPWLLLSGSQDSIKLFDLRQSEAVISYSDLSEPVRDLQFSPHKSNVFVSVQDSGYVQLYDIRKKDKFDQSFPAHNGPIFACDWHPDHADIVATAGRDQSIKVWNLSGPTAATQHIIPTMESVSKIRWSYDNKNHIASCALKRDHCINIWSVLRPYIAYARFTEPREITTGMAWRRNTTTLVSVTTDGFLYQLSTADAYRPLDHANPVGMAINPDGDIALALGNGLLRSSVSQSSSNEMVSTNQMAPSLVGGPQQSSFSNNKLPASYQATQSRGRQSLTRRSQDSGLRPRISSRSQLDVYKCTEMNCFVKTAQEYQLSNRPLAELCDHNAEVCAKLRRFQICQTWKILKLFYANIGANNNPVSSIQATNLASTSTNAANTPALTNSDKTAPATPSNNTANIVSGDELSINSQLPVGMELAYLSRSQGGGGGGGRSSMSQIQSISALNESGNDGSLAGSERSQESTDEWSSHETLSYEAFQPKHDICGRVDKLINQKLDDSHSSSGSSHDEDDLTTAIQTNSNIVNPFKASNLAHIENDTDLRISHLPNTKAYQYKFYEIIADVIADVLKYHVDNSDVQSAVSILIVLGDRIKNIVNERIPEVDRESWYYSYIDLLSKFQLWNVMAQVINLSPLSNINSINQTSTTIYTTCGTCNRPLGGKVGWICDRCKTKPSECSVCHGVVSGLIAWCQGCYHGGHLLHMSNWFSENSYCPTGCGHLCELSQWR